ncbi:MAG: hypothetical protein EHM43_02680 [Ignavibacteriae bacterium]|nr:MAG: hypothetical protein EHM43_02680 [Ignavibacteriota bacterium]
MDPVLMHLVINHVPIIGTILALGIVIVAMLIKNDTVKKTGLILFVAAGITIYPANFTGEEAEEKIEHNAGISEDQIHEHEEAAETSMTLMSIAVVLALLHLFNRPSTTSFQRLVFAAYLVTALAACTFVGIAGHEGGKIMRPELGNSRISE